MFHRLNLAHSKREVKGSAALNVLKLAHWLWTLTIYSFSQVVRENSMYMNVFCILIPISLVAKAKLSY